MTRYLWCPWTAPGDLFPAFVVARALRERGHEVIFWGPDEVSDAAAALGFAVRRARTDAFGSRSDSLDVATGMEKHLLAPLAAQLDDLATVVVRDRPDVIVDGMYPFAPRLVAERFAIAHASLCPMACPLPSEDRFPYGFGLPPPRGEVARHLARLAAQREWEATAGVRARWSRALEAFGLPARDENPWRALPSRDLILLPTTEAFEGPRPDLPPWARFIGPLVGATAEGAPLPASFARGDEPLVYASQGTIFNRDLSLLARVVAALRDEPVRVVVTTGRPLRAGELPATGSRMFVAPFVALPPLLPALRLVITHGGSGTVHTALSGGVPLLVVPLGADQPENAWRCVAAGVGEALTLDEATPERLRAATRRLLEESHFAERARMMQRDYAGHDAANEAVELLEALARRRPAPTERRSEWLQGWGSC